MAGITVKQLESGATTMYYPCAWKPRTETGEMVVQEITFNGNVEIVGHHKQAEPLIRFRFEEKENDVDN